MIAVAAPFVAVGQLVSDLRGSKTFWAAVGTVGLVWKAYAAGELTGHQAAIGSAGTLLLLCMRHAIEKAGFGDAEPTLEAAGKKLLDAIAQNHPGLAVYERTLLTLLQQRQDDKSGGS